MVSSFSAKIMVLIERLLVIRSALPATEVWSTDSADASTSKRTASPLWICGFTFKVIPTSSRVIVVNGLVLVLEAVEPVRKGTFWPTIISASWLSMVIILGVDNILAKVLVVMACIIKPKLGLPPLSV